MWHLSSAAASSIHAATLFFARKNIEILWFYRTHTYTVRISETEILHTLLHTYRWFWFSSYGFWYVCRVRSLLLICFCFCGSCDWKRQTHRQAKQSHFKLAAFFGGAFVHSAQRYDGVYTLLICLNARFAFVTWWFQLCSISFFVSALIHLLSSCAFSLSLASGNHISGVEEEIAQKNFLIIYLFSSP